MALVQAAVVAAFVLALVSGRIREDLSLPGPDEEQIISQLNKFHKFFHHPNPKAIFDQIFDPKAYFMPPGEKTREGKENITSRLRRFMKTVKELYFRSERIEVFGDIAIQVCRYEEDGRNRKVLETGRAIFVWKKDPVTKQWRILYNTWNKN